MSSNEIAERFSAACWLRVGSQGGEGNNDFDPSTLKLRSAVGFQQRIITTTNANTQPLIVLPIDRTLCRAKAAAWAVRIASVGPNDNPLSRETYPSSSDAPDSVPQVAVQLCHLDWFGPDLSNPLWLPFGLPGGDAFTVPDGFDLNTFNAVAILLPIAEGGGSSGDVCVFVEGHPILETADLPLQPDLPATAVPPPDDPILALGPIAWWRMDTYTEIDGEGGPQVVSFTGRAGGEGDLNQNGSEQGLPAPDAFFNDQQAWTPPLDMVVVSGGGSAASFWDFLLDGNFDVFIVWAKTDSGPGNVVETTTNQFDVSTDVGGTDDFGLSIGTGGAILTTAIPGFGGGTVGQLTIIRGNNSAPDQWQFGTSAVGTDDGTWDGAPGEASTGVVQFPDGVDRMYADILFFNRSLNNLEFNTVITYMTTRYSVVAP